MISESEAVRLVAKMLINSSEGKYLHKANNHLYGELKAFAESPAEPLTKSWSVGDKPAEKPAPESKPAAGKE